MISGNQIKIVSENCQGLRDKSKRIDVLTYFNNFNPSILCLLDTHLIKSDENDLSVLSGADCFISGSKTNSRGVAILIKNNFKYKIHDIQCDLDGNLLIVDLNIASISVRLVNIYGPNLDTPDFFQNLSEIIEQNKQDYLVMCGDFSVVMNPNLESYNYVSINNPKSRNLALQILKQII